MKYTEFSEPALYGVDVDFENGVLTIDFPVERKFLVTPLVLKYTDTDGTLEKYGMYALLLRAFSEDSINLFLALWWDNEVVEWGKVFYGKEIPLQDLLTEGSDAMRKVRKTAENVRKIVAAQYCDEWFDPDDEDY